MMSKLNTIFLSHGGGPLPLMGDPNHAQLTAHLKELGSTLPEPSAILVVSAHWEEEVPTITSGATPALIYDYHGFPPEAYTLTYPAPGHPTLAQKLFEALTRAGQRPRLDPKRGFDHGMFVPLSLMYPRAHIPVVQLSLTRDLDARAHLKLGEALRGLRHEGLLVIGSGFSFHNMRAFFQPHTEEVKHMNESFEAWLHEVCASPKQSQEERADHLENWSAAPYARFCHPREEHLLPLHVCVGLMQRPASEAHHVEVLKKRASTFVWRAE
jgi:aromatic ring-opening dioxygenase catalytic subunit (LigB family)